MSPFGCEKCWPPEAEEAWKAVKQVPIENYLIDEKHFIVSIRLCPSCSQRFMQVTTETIDWKDGEDPIFRTIVPITEEEQADLLGITTLSNSDIERVGVERRALKYDWPKGQQASIYWGTGVVVGLHD